MNEFNIKNSNEIKLDRVDFVDFDGNLKTDGFSTVFIGNKSDIISDNDNNRVGKIEKYNTGKVMYFIKAVKFGKQGEVVANPIEETVLTAYNETDTRSRSFYYLNVSKDLFDLYIKFLYSKNESYLLNLVRSIKNG